jgi:hypothetical protein
MKELTIIFTAATLSSVSFETGAAAAESFQKLSGPQIRAKFTRMQLTDEVHWRYVYDCDGTLKSYSFPWLQPTWVMVH